MENYLRPWVGLAQLLEELPGKWSKRYIYYLVQATQIPHYKLTKRKLLFTLDEIEKWLQKSNVEAN